MEKIVYILGAGFSAPLGLPVMSNFLERSKDQYFAFPDKFDYFKDIFERELKQVHTSSVHYQTNVFNIEDILSILEFRARLDNSNDGGVRLKQFINYLEDVIRFYTPLDELKTQPNTLYKSNKWDNYISFVAAILKCQFKDSRHRIDNRVIHTFHNFENPNHQYSIITFNYDLILESVQAHLKYFQSPRYFHRSVEVTDASNQTQFAKLHGSIGGEIIPPTWNKGLNPNMVSDWKVAYQVLSEATQIRILGYSLPPTDTYFRYLLRATVIDTPNLKWIDVLCKDENGSVKKSYDKFIKYYKYRFISGQIEDYLESNRRHTPFDGGVSFDLEQAHEIFFRKHYK